ncbi:MAG: 5-formyltetrahydrofolate cyclo-ligase [Pseudarthrobacter sp.]|nr:5-formyltetrahydrofolate cyclo-ligase [Pseudarthrobacter sp.]
MTAGSSTAKEVIRASHRAARAALDPARLEAAGAGIARHGLAWAEGISDGTPSTFCVYLGVGFEPPTVPLISALHASGHRVLLPVCEPGRNLAWVYWTPDAGLVRSRYAPILEPAGTRHGLDVAAGATALFMPATAVDRGGNRIGQGGGYYDVFLSALARTGQDLPSAAIVYDAEVLPAGSIPAEEFDRRVEAVLTPSGLIHLPAP